CTGRESLARSNTTPFIIRPTSSARGPARNRSVSRSVACSMTCSTAAGPTATDVSATRTLKIDVRNNAIAPKPPTSRLFKAGCPEKMGMETVNRPVYNNQKATSAAAPLMPMYNTEEYVDRAAAGLSLYRDVNSEP